MNKASYRIDNVTGDTFRAVCDETTHSKLDEIIAGVELGKYSWQVTYNTTTDVIQYFEGTLAGTLIATLTLTYENARKKRLVSGEWT